MIPLKFYFPTSLSQGAGFKLSQVLPVGRVVMAAQCSQDDSEPSQSTRTPSERESCRKGDGQAMDSSASRKGGGHVVGSPGSYDYRLTKHDVSQAESGGWRWQAQLSPEPRPHFLSFMSIF